MNSKFLLFFLIFNTSINILAQSKKDYKTIIEKANKEISAKNYSQARKYLAEIDSNSFKPFQLEKGFYYQQLALLAYYDTYEDEKAVNYYYKAIKIYEQNKANEDLGITYSNIVGVLTDLKRYKEAEIAINKCFPYVKKDKVRYGNAFLNYSRLKLDIGDYTKAATYNLEALKLYEQAGDKARISSGYFQMGITMETSKQFDKAIEYYNKGLSIRKILKDSLGISNIHNNLGIIYKNLKQYELAKQNYKAANDIALAMKRPVLRIRPLINMGLIYGRLNDNAAAIKNYEEALAIAEKFDRKKEIKTIESNLAYLYINVNDFEKALPLAQKAYDYGKNEGTLEEKIVFNSNLAEVLDGLGRYKEAFPFMRASYTMSDSLHIKQGSDAIAEMLTKFETQKKEQQIVLLGKENSLQKLNLQNKDLTLKQRALEIDNRDFSLNLKNKEIESQKLKSSQQQQQIQLLAKEKEINDLELRQKNIYLIISILVLGFLGFFGFQYYKKRQLAEKNRMQEEKLRISRELHDNIGAQLSFINGAIQNMAAADVDNEQLQQTQQITQNTIKELRSTVWLINGQEFSLEEFVVKLREYLKPYYGGKPNIIIANNSDKDYILEPIIASNLFRIIQEAVNNAIKYAEASILDVKLLAEKNTLEVNINDDGKGYDISLKPSGYGLKNMQARVETLKGKYNVTSEVGQGTKILLKIPI